ncbi:hypothetical protein OS347_000730 [Vibrio vulnificus]|nr:hypothetical protein [Vibrio vulnificus]
MDGYEFYGNKYWDVNHPEYVGIEPTYHPHRETDDEKLSKWIKEVPYIQSMTVMQDYLYL